MFHYVVANKRDINYEMTSPLRSDRSLAFAAPIRAWEDWARAANRSVRTQHAVPACTRPKLACIYELEYSGCLDRERGVELGPTGAASRGPSQYINDPRVRLSSKLVDKHLENQVSAGILVVIHVGFNFYDPRVRLSSKLVDKHLENQVSAGSRRRRWILCRFREASTGRLLLRIPLA